MREICMEVANQLEAVATSGEDFEEDTPDPAPAPQRFAAAVQAAVQTAAALGVSHTEELSRHGPFRRPLNVRSNTAKTIDAGASLLCPT